MKREFMEKLLAYEIEKAYGTLVPDSEEYRNRWKKSGDDAGSVNLSARR